MDGSERGKQLVPLCLALGSLVAGVVVAGIIHRALVAWVPGFFRNEDIARQEALVPALPEIARTPGPLAVIVGASTLVRLDPVRMDAALHAAGIDVTTYNLALNGAAPEVDALVVRRFERVLPKGKRLAFALLDVSLPFLTVRGRNTFEDDPVFYLSLEDGSSLWTLAQRRPGIALDAAFRRYVLGEQHNGDAAAFLSEQILDGAWHCRLQPDPGSSAAQAQALADYCDYERAQIPGGWTMSWHASTHGYDPIAPLELLPRLEKAEGFDVAPTKEQQEQRFARHVRKLVEQNDVLELNFDETSIAQLIETARRLLTFSDRVVFLISPENPLTKRSPAAEERLRALVARLRTVSPDVIDLRRDPRFEVEDFLDALHTTFGRKPSDKLAAAVADGLKPILASTLKHEEPR